MEELTTTTIFTVTMNSTEKAENPTETSPEERLAVTIMLSVFSVAGTFGNLIVLYTYGRRREKATSTIFILALAVTDFVTCFVVIPYTIVTENLENHLKYEFVCKLYHFLITSNVPYSAFIMVGIAFDRYFCICHPFLHAINVRRAKVIVILLAVLAASFGVITAQLYNVYGKTDNTTFHGLQGGLNCSSFKNNPAHTSYSSGEEQATKGIVVNINSPDNNSWEFLCNQSQSFEKPMEYAYTGICQLGDMVFDYKFISVYQSVYSSFYLLSFVAVVILYLLIYRSIHVRRAKKSRRNRSSLCPTRYEASIIETQMTVIGNGNATETDAMVNQNSSTQQKLRRQSTAQDRLIAANIKTAAMLFVVTLVFVLAFLPAWLMAHKLMGPNIIVFYVYFVYNVANPIIYAFMNRTFRDDLKQLVSKMRRQSTFRV